MGQMKINSRSFVEDVRSGLTEFDLMEKYGLTEKQLSMVFEKLLDSGKLSSGDLEHQPQFEGTVVLASTCVACGALKFVDSGACPQCGMINPGSPVTATTRIGDPTSLVEGIKSRRAGDEETTTIRTAVTDAAFIAENRPAPERSYQEFSTEIESWTDPVTEELSTASKMWGEPHEDVLPSDEELWAGGPDIELAGLSQARPAHGGKEQEGAAGSAIEETVPGRHVTERHEGPDADVQLKFAGPSQEEVDATELLPALHVEGSPTRQTARRNRRLTLAAGLVVLAIVGGGAGFFFFDDIAGFFPGGGAPPSIHTAQVKRSTPPRTQSKVETPKEVVQSTPSSEVSTKGEQIKQAAEEKPLAQPQEPRKEKPEAIRDRSVPSPSAPPVTATNVQDAQPPGSPQPQTVAKTDITVETAPKQVIAEPKPALVASKERPTTDTKPIAAPSGEPVEEKNPDSELIPAIDNEEVKKVRSLLSRGANPNATDRNGVTALLHAVETGNESLVRILLERGADAVGKGPDGFGPLERALQRRDNRVARVILSRSQDSAAASLLEAARKGDRAGLSLLLEGGADVNGTGKMGETPLMVAAGAGQIETVKLLLERGADPRLADKKGVNALGWARSPLNLGSVPLRVQREVVQLLKSYTVR